MRDDTQTEWSDPQRDTYEQLPLDAARRAFGGLVTGPHPLSIDGREFPGLPRQRISLERLRELMLRTHVPDSTRDAVWTYLVRRSRDEGGDWTLACVGMAMPSLATRARWLGERYRGDRCDAHAAALSGFLQALSTVDLADPGVMKRLVWACWEEGKAALSESLNAPSPVDSEFGSAPPPPPSGHPDLVLASAVRDEVLTPTEADLISATRLGDVALTDWGTEYGLGFWAVRKLRQRSEARLLAWLREDTDGPDSDDPVGEAAVAGTATDPRTIAADAPTPQSHKVMSGGRDGDPHSPKKSSHAVSKNGSKSALLGCGGTTSTAQPSTRPRAISEVRRCA